MSYIFVNLKRFDVPTAFGGLNRVGSPEEWIRDVMAHASALLGGDAGRDVYFLLPESLLAVARAARSEAGGTFGLGCQGIHDADVGDNGNFGAYTARTPAAAAAALGAEWAIIGHSEERRAMATLLGRLRCATPSTVSEAVDAALAESVLRARRRGIRVLFCIGETAADRGAQSSDPVPDSVARVLRRQIERGIPADATIDAGADIVLAYEPIWAIGPGKTPPDGATIGATAHAIKDACRAVFGRELPVLYGGGLKEANAQDIGRQEAIDGGLIALTRFTDPIGFSVEDLATIVREYNKGETRAR